MYSTETHSTRHEAGRAVRTYDGRTVAWGHGRSSLSDAWYDPGALVLIGASLLPVAHVEQHACCTRL